MRTFWAPCACAARMAIRPTGPQPMTAAEVASSGNSLAILSTSPRDAQNQPASTTTHTTVRLSYIEGAVLQHTRDCDCMYDYSDLVTLSHLLAGHLLLVEPPCLLRCQELVSGYCQPSAPSQTPPACISNSQCWTSMYTLPDCHMYTAARAGVALCEACLV